FALQRFAVSLLGALPISNPWVCASTPCWKTFSRSTANAVTASWRVCASVSDFPIQPCPTQTQPGEHHDHSHQPLFRTRNPQPPSLHRRFLHHAICYGSCPDGWAAGVG